MPDDLQLDPAFGHWLAGFIDGEGSFGISRKGGAAGGPHYCHFQLGIRDDDRGVLVEIVLRTGIGRIYERPMQGNSQPRSVWRVYTKVDCARLTAILDRYPLRAKKAADYALWREGVRLWLTFGGGSAHGAAGGLGELRDALTATRQYAGRAL